jgi:hypothetical protein
LLVAFVVLGFIHLSRAQDKPIVKVGDMVEAQVLGQQWRPAKVVEILRTGWLKVEWQHAGQRITPAVPPHKIRVAGKLLDPTAKPPGGGSPAAGSGSVSSDEVRQWTSAKRAPLFMAKVRAYRAGGRDLTLEKQDGTTVTLSIEEISPDDRKYLFGLLKKR